MILSNNAYIVLPVGYLIVEDNEKIVLSGIPNQRYYGVDRLPPFIAPDDEIRELLKEPKEKDINLKNALQKWFDLRGLHSSFIADFESTVQLAQLLRPAGYTLEILYCHLVLKQDEEDRVNSYLEIKEKISIISKTYGFDISWPWCTHSAIRQPGVISENSPWNKLINKWGLLDNYQDAVELRKKYLEIYPYPPFDIYLVHSLKI